MNPLCRVLPGVLMAVLQRYQLGSAVVLVDQHLVVGRLIISLVKTVHNRHFERRVCRVPPGLVARRSPLQTEVQLEQLPRADLFKDLLR